MGQNGYAYPRALVETEWVARHLSWFAFKYLLGYPQVRNYDGLWAEWGSLIDVPMEKW